MVYVLIPAHNNREEVLKVLDCLARQTYRDIKVVLVDDGSTDGTATEVEDRFPATTILEGDGNLWWTGANVKGVDYILNIANNGDFVVLLNNDLLVEAPYVETLVQASISHDRSIVGSTLVDYHDRSVVESGVRFNRRLELIVNRDRNNIESTEFDMDVDTLPGRGTLVPVEVFKKIGNFNMRKLPHYGADYEFAVRAKRAGYRLMVSHKARVYARLDITGLQIGDRKIISYAECFRLLFSKKSKTHLVYYLNYFWLCSEKEDRVRNVFVNAGNLLARTLMRTFLFFPIYMACRYIYIFLASLVLFIFGRYPLRISDIEHSEISLDRLLALGILEKRSFRERTYYHFARHFKRLVRNLKGSEWSKIESLQRLSLSYVHKTRILYEKIHLLILERTAG